MQAEWFYGISTNRLGPVTITELQRLMMAGQIGPQTLVWSDGMPKWVPAASLPFLNAAGAAYATNNSAGLNLLLPIGPQSGMAIAAGYLGLFGLLIPLLAIAGLVLGILALRDIKAHPEKRGKGRAITGIVCGGLWTIAVLILLISR